MAILTKLNPSHTKIQNGGDIKVLIDNSSIWDCDILVEVLTQGNIRSKLGSIKFDNQDNSYTELISNIIPNAQYIFTLINPSENSNVKIEFC